MSGALSEHWAWVSAGELAPTGKWGPATPKQRDVSLPAQGTFGNVWRRQFWGAATVI